MSVLIKIISFCLLVSLAGLVQAAKTELVLGVFQYQAKADVEKEFSALTGYLEQKLPNVDIQLKVLDYETFRQEVREGTIDLMLVNPSLYESIRSESFIAGITATLQKKQGGVTSSSLGGVIFTRPGNSSVNTLTDLSTNKIKIAIPSKNHSGAFHIPLYELYKSNINIDALGFIEVRNNDAVVQAVLSGEIDVGFVRTGVLENYSKNHNEIALSDFKIINNRNLKSYPFELSTSLYPEWPFIILPNVPESLAREVTSAIFSINEDTKVFEKSSIAGFVSPLDYKPFENLLRELKLHPYEFEPVPSFEQIWNSYADFIIVISILVLFIFLLLILTERNKRQAVQSHRQLADLIRATKTGSWEWHVQNGGVLINEYYASMLGYRPDELDPFSMAKFESMLHPDDYKKVIDEANAHLAFPNREYNVEFRIQNKKGEYHWIKASGRTIKFDKYGHPEIFSGTHTDIDELKQSAIQIEENAKAILTLSKRYKAFLELSSEAVFIMDAVTGDLIEYSEQSKKYLGYSDEEMQTLNVVDWDRLITPEIFQGIVSELNYEPLQIERTHTRKDGSEYIASINIRLVEIDDQDYIYAAARDITENKKLESLLLDDKHFIETIIDTASAIVAVIRLDGTMTLLNQYGQSFTGYSQKQVSSEPYFWSRFLNVAIRNQVESIIDKASQGEIVRSYRNGWIDHSGHERMIEWSNNLLYDSNNEVEGVITIGIDIEKSYQLTQRLNLANTIIESAINGVVVTDENNTIVQVNESFTKISGYSHDELIGKPPEFNKSGVHATAFYKELWHELIKNKTWRGEITNKRKDGSLYTCLLNISVIETNDGKISNYAAIYSDITDINESRQQLSYVASHDALTQLPNRLLFSEELNKAVSQAQRNDSQLALMFFDIDRFKQINDTFGHEQGDELLKQVANRITQVIRSGDTFARLGGDEFVLLTENIDNVEMTGYFTEKILNEFSKPIQLLDGLSINISTSIGIAIYPKDGSNSTELLSNADSAMYKAKSLGGNQYSYYNSELTVDIKSKLLLENKLRFAIEEQELSLAYQPQVNSQTQKLLGFEALLRWHNKELGTVSPIEFIPVAEETGLILKLGEWVLSEAFHQADVWIKTGVEFKQIAVNMSALQLQSDNFIELLERLLRKYDLSAQYFELEITENILVKNTEQMLQKLNAIRDLGFKISIDDFGTGFSSLSYLKKLPINQLKIDKSFVTDIPEDKEDIAITKAVIALAQSLNLEVIAEGVETQQQVDFLAKYGCNLCQGYFFSKPITNSECESYINSTFSAKH